MLNIKKLLASSCVLFFSLSGSAYAQDWRSSVESVTKGVIQPGYQSLEVAFGRLEAQSQAFCAEPKQATYETAQQAWREAILAWMDVSWIHFGPVSTTSARFDIQIWPIRKGITHKKVQALLALPEVTAQDVVHAGVSVRGLTGSEYLLFSGSGGTLAHYQDETATNRCRVLIEAVKASHKTIESLNAGWQTDKVITPYYQGVDMLDRTKESASAASIVWNALISELEFIQLRKLEGPLNPHAKKAKPTAAESWRSLHSFENITRGLTTLKRVYQAGYQAVVASQNKALDKQVILGFDQLIQRLSSFEQPLKEMLKNDAGREQLKAFDAEVRGFYELLRNQVTPLTGFVLGFNANDGD
ncbi:imelysin family protein [Litoribrevibacter euphylliae]|uniref:Imelysin family protein n=1 Tax=Litoribrevibacter euphylliae TaxID=1834034 RepID=A0ABV7HCN3_9GAMM